MRDRCEREVIELHKFFQDWFNGVLEQNESVFARFKHVIHSDFEIIPPDAEPVKRSELIERLYNAYGSSADSEKPMQIWVENFDVRYLDDYLVLATYEEWQELNENVNARISTVLFKVKPEAPNGVEWLHVHETRIQT